MRNLQMITERKIKMVIVDQGEDLVNMFKLLLDRTGVFDIKMEKDPSRVDGIARAFEPDFVVLGSRVLENDAAEIVSQMKPEIDSEPYKFFSPWPDML